MGVARRVLVIDDNPDQRDALAGELMRRGWIVETASNARAGLDCASKCQPDVVLTELTLPDTRGFHFARALRSLIDHDVVLVGVTRLPLDQHDSARAAGFDEVHAKPIDLETLAKLLR